MELKSIGEVIAMDNGFGVKLDKEYVQGLQGLEGFSAVTVIWWADNREEYGSYLLDKPYKKGPEKIGLFSTRSQIRPNPICTTIIYVNKVDLNSGIIKTWYIDAFPGTKVLDIKPFHPCSDVLKNTRVPDWCDHWPKSIDDSGSFNWEEEFNF